MKLLLCAACGLVGAFYLARFAGDWAPPAPALAGPLFLALILRDRGADDNRGDGC